MENSEDWSLVRFNEEYEFAEVCFINILQTKYKMLNYRTCSIPKSAAEKLLCIAFCTTSEALTVSD
jgi:hypothetical protein